MSQVAPPVVIVGGGHNGLVCACYLALAGVRVLVLEQSDKPGGGSRTEATIEGLPHRFDLHSVAHNIINMTSIPAELDLAGAGLVYQQMDPFAIGTFADGRIVRFHRSIDRTLASIAEHDRAEAQAYARLMHRAVPLVQAAVTGLDSGAATHGLGKALRGKLIPAARAVHRAGGPFALGHDLVQPYAALLQTALPSDLTRAPIAAFAAHSSAGPHVPGGSFYALWQAAYHLFGQWHARGGSGGLIDALLRRLQAAGGLVRCGADVVRIDATGGRAIGVVLADGERIPALAVVSAIDVQSALLHLLDPPLAGRHGAELSAAHRGNAVQMLVHLAVDRLPGYPGARAGDWNGLQSHVDSLEELTDGFQAAQARRLPDPVPTYLFSTSALDDTLAPAGQHTVYLACPCAPYRTSDGWTAHAEPFADQMVAQVERHAPGFTKTITGRSIRTPELMAGELAWPGAHPMHLDITLDQLAFLRPTRALADHRVPGVTGLFTCGAGTAPVGGIAGSPGKAAALAVLAEQRKPGAGRSGSAQPSGAGVHPDGHPGPI